MNKEYVDTEQMEGHLLDTSFASQSLAKGSKTTSFSIDAVHGLIKQYKDVRKVKPLLRNNELPVDHDSRTHLWTLLTCKTIEKIVDETFQMYASKFANVKVRIYVTFAPERMLPIGDMDEEMRVHHMLSVEGVRACHRVLYAIAETHPHIQQFSPLLYAFTSVMLHYADEQATFRCICELMKDSNYFLAPSEIVLIAACFVLKDLAYRYAKSAAAHIEQHCPDQDFTMFLNDWVLWIFKHLPFHYLVRIIDCYLVEGYKVLFRVALVLIRLFHKISAQKSEFMDAGKPDVGIKSMCAEIHKYISCDRLLKEAFGIRGFSKKEIDSLFNKAERELRASGGALTYRPQRPSQDMLPSSVPRPWSSHSLTSQPSAKKLQAKKKSFRLDKDVHTQLVLDDLDSDILAKHQLLTLWSWLPPAEGVKEPLRVFTTNEHGYSLKTLYEKVEEYGPTLIVLRTVDNDIFGAYCGTDWVERHKHIDAGAQISFFGCGQSFVFKIYPDVCYPWVGKETPVTLASASMFQAGDRNVMMIGGGDGCALQIDKDLDYGRSERCDTFANDPLCDDMEFRIQMLEAIVFTS